MTTTVINNNGARYLAEFPEFQHDLPDNVFFNKITTGSGMTTISLANDVKYVLCVPFKNLVKNKLEWCTKNNIPVIGVYAKSEGGASVDEIKKFKGNKIITTWDSLSKVVEALGDSVGEWKILVDEAHQLVHSGCFRTDAVEQVLDNYTKFKSFIFGTATPVKEQYQLPALKHIDRVEIKWDNLDIVNVHYTKYEKDLNKAVAVLGIKYLNGELNGNAHIFINSVKSITSIIRHIKKSGIDPSELVRIVCSDTPRNNEIITESIGKAYAPSSINSAVKKLNFYTSTAFEGCDIYDSTGKTYIISDGGKDHSKIDILTALPQIIARVRDAAVKNFVELWFTPNRYYSHTTEEQFEATVKKYIDEARITVQDYERSSPQTQELLRKGAEDSAYFRVVNDTLKVNDTAWYAEMNAFNTLHRTYYVNKDKELKAKTVKLNTIDYAYQPTQPIQISGINKVQLGKRASYNDLAIDYITAVSNGDISRMEQIEIVEPSIKEAYEVLGVERMETLLFRKSWIERELVAVNSIKSNDWKITKLLDLKTGEWVSRAYIKEKLQDIYEHLGIKKTAKATDLNKYYVTEAKNRRVEGELVHGLVIVTPLINIK